MKFAEKVKNARIRLGITQEQMAQKLKISFNTLNRWENGRTVPHAAITELFYNFCLTQGISFAENGDKVEAMQFSVKASAHTAVYKMHKYFARRPCNVFNHIISHYTKENDIILDCFCGGGVTVFEGLRLGRKVMGMDINPLATFITKMQVKPEDKERLSLLFEKFIETLKNKYEFIYKHDNEIIEWSELAYLITCPNCGAVIELTEKNKVRNGVYKSSSETCGCGVGIRRVDGKPSGYKYDKLVFENKRSEKVTWKIDNDFAKLIEGKVYPKFEIPKTWDRQMEDGLGSKGILQYKDFFTEKNFAANVLVFNEILNGGYSEDEKEWLFFLFSSSLRYTNNMTRVTENWENGKPTSMDKHAFWFPNVFVENNVFNILASRAKTVIAGVKYANNEIEVKRRQADNFDELALDANYLIINGSSTTIPAADKSVDFVLTDPPYGSNVQYAELSIIWTAWYPLFGLSEKEINNGEEAVVNRRFKGATAKTIEFYEQTLTLIFKECFRVLKDEGFMVFTFNNKNIHVWIAMLKAVAKAGFNLAEKGMIYQDFVESYRNTAHLKYDGTLQGDFIYTFQKAESNKVENDDYFTINEVINDTLNKLYLEKDSYSTTELYQSILNELSSAIIKKIRTTGIDYTQIKSDEIELVISGRLRQRDGLWREKQ